MSRTSDWIRWRCWASSFALALAWTPAAWADLWPCGCHNDQPCCAPYYHPSFGYYPTQWRAWSVAEPVPVLVAPAHNDPIPVSVPTTYTAPARLIVERTSAAFAPPTTEMSVARPPVVTPAGQPALLNLNPASASGLDDQRAAGPERPAVLNLGGVLPEEHPGVSYRSLP